MFVNELSGIQASLTIIFVSWAIFEQFSPLGRVNATSLAYRRTTRLLAKDDEHDIPNES